MLEEMNIGNAHTIGHTMFCQFKVTLPFGFHIQIKEEVVWLETLEIKRAKVDGASISWLEKLHACLFVMLQSLDILLRSSSTSSLLFPLPSSLSMVISESEADPCWLESCQH